MKDLRNLKDFDDARRHVLMRSEAEMVRADASQGAWTRYEVCLQGNLAHRKHPSYRGTSLIRNTPLPKGHHVALDTVLV